MTPAASVVIDHGVAPVTTGPFEIMAAYTCDNCRRLLLVHQKVRWDPGTPEQALRQLDKAPDTELNWIPRGGEGRSFEDVPDHIAAAASEAYECFSIGAYRATVAMTRAVVEATAKDRGITTGNLASKIDAMESATLLRPGH